jgi:signal transduction histidine kinase
VGAPHPNRAILADAADVLSDQLRVHLQRLADLLSPQVDILERRFLRRLQKLGFDGPQRTASAAITLGAAARILGSGAPVAQFFEQVEYNGRRLAKLNLPPSRVVEALAAYDELLTPALATVLAPESADFQWVREQVHFCVVLTLNNAYYQVREAETQAFYELFRVELESRNLGDLLHRFLTTLLEVCGADAAKLFLLDEEQYVWEPQASVTRGGNSQGHGNGNGNGNGDASGSNGPKRLPNLRQRLKLLGTPRAFRTDNAANEALLDPAWRSRYASVWSIPLTADGQVSGAMQFGFENAYEWLPREQDLLAAAAERCLMAAEKARLIESLAAREEQVRQLAEHMLHVEEVERRRISRELHDEAGQSLLCIRLQMEMLEHAISDAKPEWRDKLRDAREMTERTILEMRRLIAALSPAVLEQLGLASALRQLVNRLQRLHPCRAKFHLGKVGRLPNQTEVIVYRLVQECCNNIAKHSGAANVNISLNSADGRLKLLVEDDGVGFQVDTALTRRESFGLSGIRERVALLGGKFDVVSRPAGASPVRGVAGGLNRGTRISVELPIPAELIDSEGRGARSAWPAVRAPQAARAVETETAELEQGVAG